MSDVSLAEISKGVWVPRGLSRRPAGGVMNPEDEEDECRCMLPGYKGEECREEEEESFGLPRRAAGAGLARQNAEADDAYVAHCIHPTPAGRADRAEEAVRPLEPVAALTYEQARKMGDAARAAAAAKAAKQDAVMEKAFKNNPSDADSYKEAEWNEVPETEATAPISAAWYSCVKRYRFIQYGGAPLAGGPKLIIEVGVDGWHISAIHPQAVAGEGRHHEEQCA